MQKIPKQQPFHVPENYFEELPEKIMGRASRPKPSQTWTWAAAAVVLLGVGLWQAGEFNAKPSTPITSDQEALLYIESEQWNAEDVLSLSHNPNELLDQIIEEELAKSEPLWTEEETWF
jgi:hypothetical protein